MRPRRTWRGAVRLTSVPGEGEPNPTWIPAANAAYRRMAAHLGGFAASSVGEVADVPMTAHFLGGCTIGVVGRDRRGRRLPPGVRLPGPARGGRLDVSANLGVNPSLTITAQAERAFALWPNAGEADPRPALGEPYQRLRPVRPVRPAVPASAPGALRLTVL